jgi:pseudouridine-5'-phosphate glycosidase
MPYPQNFQVAQAVEQIVRDEGAIPATIAVLNGVPHVGLTPDELHDLAKNQHDVVKASTRDLAYIIASHKTASTTVASTMRIAQLANIEIFATGGIGGVHRGAETTFDISNDLIELGRIPILVVCAGIKSILDIPKSLEYLETQGVPIIGFQTKAFPSFFTNDSGHTTPCFAKNADDAARIFYYQRQICSTVGSIVAVPNPEPADSHVIQTAIDSALLAAEKMNIRGNAMTPFLLSRIEKITEGHSLHANIALIKNNAKVAGQIAKAYKALQSNDSVKSSASSSSSSSLNPAVNSRK